VVALSVAVGACSGEDGGSDSAGDDPAAADEGGADEGGGADPTGADAAPDPSAGCEGGPTAQADLEEMTLDVGGVARRALVSAPAWDGDDPLPLVLDIHGLAEGADVHAQMSQLGPMGVEEGFIAVFPHGTGEPVRWDVGPDPTTNPDLAYVTALLDTVEAERCVDRARVYATGLSNGAMMSSTLACAMADRIAAIAPVAGVQMPDGCDPARPVPVLTFHGTADPILLFNGGVNTDALAPVLGGDEGGGGTTTTRPPADLEGPGYPETVAEWAALNGCEDAFTDEDVTETVVLRTYDCPREAPVDFYIVEGGGHTWPSSEFSRSIESIAGPTTFDIDASELAWEFFRQFALPADD
jgi:polyhydroxybutyrate depolymerase